MGADDQVLVGSSVDAIDGRPLAAQTVLFVPQQKGDTVFRVVVADVAGQEGRLTALVRDVKHLQQQQYVYGKVVLATVVKYKVRATPLTVQQQL